MPNYKVVNADQLDADLEAVAQAIRTKGGTSASLAFPSGFVSAVEGIQSGGGVGNSDAIIGRTVTEIKSNVEAVGEYAFRGCTALRAVNLPSAKTIGTYAFYNCTSLINLQLPEVQTIATYGFYGCSGLSALRIPKLSSLGSTAFRGCTSLYRIFLPRLGAVSANAFYGCTGLEVADMGAATSIASQAFYNCHSLKALVLRSTSHVTLSGATSLASCYWLTGAVNAAYNPNGGRGYVYVPATRRYGYPNATNWASFDVRFRVLEDYTIDGTIDGELDIEKMLTNTSDLGFGKGDEVIIPPIDLGGGSATS